MPSGSNLGTIRKSSGTIPLQPTGLITSGPLNSCSRRSVQLGQGEQADAVSGKAGYCPGVTSLGEEVGTGFRVSKAVVWMVVAAAAMGLMVGAFLMVAVKKMVVLGAVSALVVPMGLVLVSHCIWGRKCLLGFVKRYPDAELRGAVDELYEYKGWGGKPADSKQRCFSWGYYQSGLRALVKAGYGSKVAPFIKPATVVDVTKENNDLSPSFSSWLAERNLSRDDCTMRLEEGYVEEGSTVVVMGVVRHHDYVLMIVSPSEPISPGCQWSRCFLPAYVEGLILS
ncbi:putative short-chain dehydrogenase [Hibiscus syriacus]|uniref:Short-chain dehydrogenase n=1 Tax=Hibiscus syriacus TaxID=106335 RepID=A0A6A2ZZB8_HIBSY|nr:putative short-chain dehydrogenase [Hibiscus syriacus]